MEISPNSNTYAILLGRFCPLHLGHQKSIDTLIQKFGLSNVILMVGSSNAYNSRTPYTYQARKTMLNTVYPDILVIPIPDSNPALIHFDGKGNYLWLESIKKIEAEMGANFVFYGGSKEDLEVLAQGFKTAVLVDREQMGGGASATQVREALDKGDTRTLESLLDPRVLPLALSAYQDFQNTL